MIDATPTSPEDSELLRRYAADGSQAAFAELVRRRIDLVYSVALRQTHGDRHRAEDATQAVFADLARKAATLARRTVLAGWLYRSAQFAATGLVRAEARRSARERTAHTMHTDLAPERSPADWEKVRPVLDQALGEMDETDRDAIVLRFFDQRPFADIGARLRLTENAARMRVERALDKLAALLARRGITSTAAALGTALGAQVATVAPAGLAASVASAVVAPVAASGSLLGLFTLGKLQLGLGATLAVGGGALLAHQAQTNAGLRREIAAARPAASALTSLRTENLHLIARIAEAEALQRDVADLASLERGVAAARQTIARRQTASSASTLSEEFQAQVDRLNQEGNALVKRYKEFSAQARDTSLSEADRLRASGSAQATLSAVRAKQAEARQVTAAFQSKWLFKPGAAPAPQSGDRGGIRTDPVQPTP